MKFIFKKLSTSELEKSFNILQFIESHNGLVFHEPELNRIVSEQFNTKFYYYTVTLGYDIIALCPIHTMNKGFVKKTETKPLYDIPYGGFVFEEGKVSEKELIKYIKPAISERIYYFSNPFNYSQIEKTNSYLKKETAIINLALSEEDIWLNVINSKRRNMIRKAQKSGIVTQKYSSQESLKLFWPLLENLHKKHWKINLPIEYYIEIINFFSSKNKAKILIALKNEKVLSGIILIGNENVMHYWKGASKQGVKNEGQGELLQWEAIKWAKNSGAKYYDLCVVEPERLPHIAKFKMGFSKQLVPFIFFQKDHLLFKLLIKCKNCFHKK